MARKPSATPPSPRDKPQGGWHEQGLPPTSLRSPSARCGTPDLKLGHSAERIPRNRGGAHPKRARPYRRIVLLEGCYAHLPLKRAMHAVDPLQRLRLLRHRLGQFVTESSFHAEMNDIFTSLRDLHTNYLLPAPFNRVAAALPFGVKFFGTRTSANISSATSWRASGT
jgi:hypothetical protein